MPTIDIRQTVGGGYDEFWTFRGRYRVCKGGRGSKKSTTTALWIVYEMMRYWAQYRLFGAFLMLPLCAVGAYGSLLSGYRQRLARGHVPLPSPPIRPLARGYQLREAR